MVDDLKGHHLMLNHEDVTILHYQILIEANDVEFPPVYDREDYVRLMVATKEVFSGPPGQESIPVGQAKFDEMLAEQKELIEEV
jgi:hypothetical protein